MLDKDTICNAIDKAFGIDNKEPWCPKVGDTVIVRTMYLPKKEYLCEVTKVTSTTVFLADHHRFKRPTLIRIGSKRGWDHQLHEYIKTQ